LLPFCLILTGRLVSLLFSTIIGKVLLRKDFFFSRTAMPESLLELADLFLEVLFFVLEAFGWYQLDTENYAI
jgi:hypothetical protein